jgi:hypothetical protein
MFGGFVLLLSQPMIAKKRIFSTVVNISARQIEKSRTTVQRETHTQLFSFSNLNDD